MIDFDEPNLTPDYVLSKVSEEQIYSYYLQTTLKPDRLVKCCFHDDRTPSLGFYQSNHGLKYKCFSCGETGGVFNFVMNLHNCSFKDALQLINKDFNIQKNDNVTNAISVSHSFRGARLRTQIIPTFRPFNKFDYDYWHGRYYISLEDALFFEARACKLVYIVNKMGHYNLWAEHQVNNPIYSYHMDGNYKIYRPFADKRSKWISNTTLTDIQGMKQLPSKSELLIITSSMKDVMVLKVLGYNAIALGGEGNNLPEDILDYLYECFDNIIVFYDNDKAGIEYGKKFSQQIGAGNISIPNEYTDTKDISDFICKYRWEETKRLMKILI